MAGLPARADARSPDRTMQPIRPILGKFVKELNLEGGVALQAVRKRWAAIVGEAVAKHTFPDTIRGQSLTVIVDTPQWMHHLGFFRQDILAKLAGYRVSDLRFRLGSISPSGEGAPRAGERPLSDEEARYVENTVSRLGDEELKKAFRNLIRHGLTRKRGGR